MPQCDYAKLFQVLSREAPAGPARLSHSRGIQPRIVRGTSPAAAWNVTPAIAACAIKFSRRRGAQAVQALPNSRGYILESHANPAWRGSPLLRE
jgi:hypothetical protein